MRSADRNDASQTTNTPSGKCADDAAATASATAVLPTPPGPVTVVNDDRRDALGDLGDLAVPPDQRA